MADFAQLLARRVELFRRERALAYTRAVGLDDADDLIDLLRSYTGTDGDAPEIGCEAVTYGYVP